MSKLEQENIGKRIGKLEKDVGIIENTVADHSRQLIRQSEKNETLTKLATLMERQIEETKERDRRQEIRDEKQNSQMESFGDTLKLINSNLTNLNSKQELLDNRVTGIETTLDLQKIDPIRLFKAILSYFATGIGSIAIAYLIWLFTKK
ncbi:MAG: hypothetical protein K0S80_2918 [Neobacillus sp.]|nr:hypothetical protein [Neobacillus sp.]